MVQVITIRNINDLRYEYEIRGWEWDSFYEKNVFSHIEDGGKTPYNYKLVIFPNGDKRLYNNFKFYNTFRKSEYTTIRRAGDRRIKENREKLGLKPSCYGCNDEKDVSFTEEYRLKLSAAHKGLKHSEETKKKIGEAHRGKKWSEETRKKMSEKQKIAQKIRREREKKEKENS